MAIAKSSATEQPESVALDQESTASKLATEHDISPAAVRKFATFSQAADTLAADGAPLQRVLEQPKAAVIKAGRIRAILPILQSLNFRQNRSASGMMIL